MATTKTTAAKPAATSTTKKAATKKTAVKKPAVKKTTTTKTTTRKPAAKKTKPSPEALYKMTEVAAYYIALNDGFAGNPSEYWLAAEIQIKKLHK